MSAATTGLEISHFARDIVSLSAFYAELFDVPYIDSVSTPIYRALDVPGTRLAFHDFKAYALLELADRIVDLPIKPVGTYVTFNVAGRSELEARMQQALQLGARLLKPPYVSYYNAYQAVLADPEDNVFRLNYQM
jgi:hypothetical protein